MERPDEAAGGAERAAQPGHVPVDANAKDEVTREPDGVGQRERGEHERDRDGGRHAREARRRGAAERDGAEPQDEQEERARAEVGEALVLPRPDRQARPQARPAHRVHERREVGGEVAEPVRAQSHPAADEAEQEEAGARRGREPGEPAREERRAAAPLDEDDAQDERGGERRGHDDEVGVHPRRQEDEQPREREPPGKARRVDRREREPQREEQDPLRAQARVPRLRADEAVQERRREHEQDAAERLREPVRGGELRELRADEPLERERERESRRPRTGSRAGGRTRAAGAGPRRAGARR